MSELPTILIAEFEGVKRGRIELYEQLGISPGEGVNPSAKELRFVDDGSLAEALMLWGIARNLIAEGKQALFLKNPEDELGLEVE